MVTDRDWLTATASFLNPVLGNNSHASDYKLFPASRQARSYSDALSLVSVLDSAVSLEASDALDAADELLADEASTEA